MIFELVSKGQEEPIDRVDMANVGVAGAKTYFMGRKQMKDNEKSFDDIWKVMEKKDYDKEFKNNLYDRQMGKRKYEWWKDEESYLDVDAPITQSMRDEEE